MLYEKHNSKETSVLASHINLKIKEIDLILDKCNTHCVSEIGEPVSEKEQHKEQYEGEMSYNFLEGKRQAYVEMLKTLYKI